MTGDDLVRAARRYIGVPFRHQGRSVLGLDCIGLVVCAARDIGLTLRDRTDYPRDPNGELPAELAAQTEPADSVRPGDLALMAFAGQPTHVAILAGDTLIHGYASVGRVVEHRIDARWRSRIVSVHRLRGIA